MEKRNKNSMDITLSRALLFAVILIGCLLVYWFFFRSGMVGFRGGGGGGGGGAGSGRQGRLRYNTL